MFKCEYCNILCQSKSGLRLYWKKKHTEYLAHKNSQSTSNKTQNKPVGKILPLVKLCMNVVENNWDNYEFDFTDVSLDLKFKVLLFLVKIHPTLITENDLHSIFVEDFTNLENNVSNSQISNGKEEIEQKNTY